MRWFLVSILIWHIRVEELWWWRSLSIFYHTLILFQNMRELILKSYIFLLHWSSFSHEVWCFLFLLFATIRSQYISLLLTVLSQELLDIHHLFIILLPSTILNIKSRLFGCSLIKEIKTIKWLSHHASHCIIIDLLLSIICSWNVSLILRW